MIELLHGDCMDYMATLEDNAFDLAIVDPPYGIGFDKKIREKEGKGWDLLPPTKEYFNELKRVSLNQIIWGANYFESLWPCRGFIFWDKDVNFDSYSSGELAFTSFEKPARYYYYAWNGLANGIRGRNKKLKTIHPTQKPVKLYEWLLKNYAKEGDKILDTHLGSGSSAIAAYNYKFDFVGIELDEDYYNAAVKRYNEYIKQLQLF